MTNYEIFSDGACDLGTNRTNEYQISIIPFYVSLNHETYHKEIDEISLETYYKSMQEKKIYPKTSLPSVQDYIDAFRPTLQAEKDILCVTISERFSSSIQSAQTAKSILLEEFPERKIYIENSMQATAAQGILVMELSKMKQAGKSIEELLSFLRQNTTCQTFFMVGDLSYLETGGRLQKLATLSGSILKIKPLIQLKDGNIQVLDVVRSQKKGFHKLVHLTQQYFESNQENPAHYMVAVGYTNDYQELSALEVELKSKIPELTFLSPFQIGATIASHTGLGTMGVCICKKYEYVLALDSTISEFQESDVEIVS